jgi:hypothetical protein
MKQERADKFPGVNTKSEKKRIIIERTQREATEFPLTS